MDTSDSLIPSPQPNGSLDQFETFAPSVSTLSANRIVGFSSFDRRTRAFNMLRTTLYRRFEELNGRLLGITSAAPDAGKSFLSLNLAASLSRVVDGPVFLVDVDIRRASLAEQLGLECDGGVAKILSGEISNFEAVGRRIEDTNLVVFPTARVDQGSAEYFTGSNFPTFVANLSARFSPAIVLFDMPPAFASDDAMLIMEHLDAYVLVVDAGKTRKRQINQALRLLEPKPCLGTVLNRFHGGLTDSYGYGYGSYAYSQYYN